jgi:SNF2 family DNA or RNA helicase
MLIIRKKKAVIIKSRHPSRILNVIPTAKRFPFKGQELVAIPHRIDETRVLRNMGYDVPSPIKYYYPFPGRFTPFIAQRETSDFLTMNPRAFCLNDLGTGKTQAALWAYDYLRSIGKAKRLLVVSPLSTLERTWGDAIFMNFPHLEFSVLHGSKARRLKLLNQQSDVYLINHHGLEIIQDELAKRADIDIVIIDEIAQVGRTAGTNIWKAMNTVCNKQFTGSRMTWGLTGTPTPNAPTDAWAQCRLLVPHRVPPYFKRFKEAVMRQYGPFTWVPKPEAVEIVREAMQPAIRFTRDQCIDLPDCMYQTREVELTPEQKKAYKEMHNTLRTEAAEGKVLAVNEAVKMSKLVQIACGVVYGMNGEEVTIPAVPRLKVVAEIVESAATKTIVFVPFRSSVGVVANYLEQQGYSVACIHGGVSKHERDRIFSEFQKLDHPQVLVAQPAAMSHGLTLVAANTIVWYAPVTSNETYEQANGRITRPGQLHQQFIIHIEGTAIERKIYDRLKNKQKTQGLLLDLVQEDFDKEVEQV